MALRRGPAGDAVRLAALCSSAAGTVLLLLLLLFLVEELCLRPAGLSVRDEERGDTKDAAGSGEASTPLRRPEVRLIVDTRGNGGSGIRASSCEQRSQSGNIKEISARLHMQACNSPGSIQMTRNRDLFLRHHSGTMRAPAAAELHWQ